MANSDARCACGLTETCKRSSRTLGAVVSPLTVNTVLEMLCSIRHKWKFLGIALGIDMTTLNRISEQYPNQLKEALLEVIEEWLNSDLSSSWEGMLEALQTKTVGESRLADTISDAIRQAPRTRKRRAQLMTPSPFNRKFLLEVLLPIQHKWKFIGIALGVEFTTLHRISERYPTQAKEALLEVIEEWLNSDLPSWEGLLEALRTSTVGEDRLADSYKDLKPATHEQPLTTFQEAPCVQQDAVVTDIHIAEIATDICNWEELAPFLSLSPAEEEEIRNDFQGRYGLQKREALRKWKERMGSKATYSALVEVFSSRKKTALVNKLKHLFDQMHEV